MRGKRLGINTVSFHILLKKRTGKDYNKDDMQNRTSEKARAELKIREYLKIFPDYFFFISQLNIYCDPSLNRLIERVQMRAHNICF